MIAPHLLAQISLLGGWAIYLPLLCWAVWRAPWVELFTDIRRQHLLFGTVLALFLLWLVRRDFPSGVSFHFIGMTAVVLLLDWRVAQDEPARLVGLLKRVAPGARVVTLVPGRFSCAWLASSWAAIAMDGMAAAIRVARWQVLWCLRLRMDIYFPQ